MKTDIWSLGCILYFMLHKKPPVDAANIEELTEKMQNLNEHLKFDPISNDLQNLIKFILKVNPDERPTVEQILSNKIFD